MLLKRTSWMRSGAKRALGTGVLCAALGGLVFSGAVQPRRAEAGVKVPLPPYYEVDTGTNLEFGDDDTALIDLGFNFPFQGQVYTQVTVTDNGFIWLGDNDDDDCCDGDPFEFVTEGPRIAGAWHDLDPRDGGAVRYRLFPDRAVFTWEQVPTYDDESIINTFQIQILQDGRVLISTVDAPSGGDDILVGVTPGDLPGGGPVKEVRAAGEPTIPAEIDLSANRNFNTGTEGTVYEHFDIDADVPEDSDLEGLTIVFTPNGQGGWFVSDQLVAEAGFPGLVAGNSILQVGENRAIFNVRANSLRKKPVGSFVFLDPRARLHVRSTRIQSVEVFNGNRAVITGVATVNRVRGRAFTLTIIDNGNSRLSPDTAYLQIEGDPVLTLTGPVAVGGFTVQAKTPPAED